MNKGINDIKNINLTHSEKTRILNNIVEMPIVSPYAPKQSIWNFAFNKFAYVTSILLIVAMTGGTLAYADEYSLPGDMLYPIKRNITEPMHSILANTPSARAEWEATKAMRRLSEAELLAKRNDLTPEKKTKIEKDFKNSVAAFRASLQSISTSTGRSEELGASFEESMKNRTDIIQRISSGDKLEENDIELENESENRASTSQKESRDERGESREGDDR